MSLIVNIFRGIMIGIANVIPGVSGGTMAVSFGIYDKLISSVTHFFRDWKASVRFLLPIGIGVGIGIIAFSYAIEFLFGHYPVATGLTFIGLILGGVPIVYQAMKADLDKHRKKFGVVNIILFLLFFASSSMLPLVNSSNAGADFTSVNTGLMVMLFLMGMIASATMIIPGVSGSMVLLILGYYDSIIAAITGFLDALIARDMEGLIHGFTILMPFGIGVVLGIVIIAKIIELLFKHFCSQTYSAILGLICSSPIAIFLNMRGDESIQIQIMEIVIGAILLIVGGYLTYRVGKSEH